MRQPGRYSYQWNHHVMPTDGWLNSHIVNKGLAYLIIYMVTSYGWETMWFGGGHGNRHGPVFSGAGERSRIQLAAYVKLDIFFPAEPHKLGFISIGASKQVPTEAQAAPVLVSNADDPLAWRYLHFSLCTLFTLIFIHHSDSTTFSPTYFSAPFFTSTCSSSSLKLLPLNNNDNYVKLP